MVPNDEKAQNNFPKVLQISVQVMFLFLDF